MGMTPYRGGADQTMVGTSSEALHEALDRASQVSGAWEQALARLPGFAVPCSLRLRRMGERIVARWGVDACAQVIVCERWRQAAFLLVAVSAPMVASGVLPLQLAGVALDVMALGCVWKARLRRNASGILVARPSKVGKGHVPV